MNELTVTNQNGLLLVDSREVAEMTNTRHGDLLEKIGGYIKHLENGKFRSQDFFIPDTYKVEGNNKTYDSFLLTRKGCDMVANKLTGEKGVLFTAAYVTKFEEMELQQSEPDLTHFKKEAHMIEITATVLRLPDSGRLKLLGDFNKAHKLNVPLPGYADEPITESATELLKKHGVSIQTKAFNLLLIGHGLLEERERPSSKGGIKPFKSITNAGLVYGKNIINPNNQRETAPHYYPNKFAELLELIGIGNGAQKHA